MTPAKHKQIKSQIVNPKFDDDSIKELNQKLNYLKAIKQFSTT